MVGLLVMVLLSIVSRQLHFHVPGTDAYAGYLMAAAGFLALAHTLKRGEHIRVTLLLSALHGGARRALEIWALAVASLLAVLLAFYSCRLAWQSLRLQRHLHRQRRHAAVDPAAGDGRRHGRAGDRLRRRAGARAGAASATRPSSDEALAQ